MEQETNPTVERRGTTVWRDGRMIVEALGPALIEITPEGAEENARICYEALREHEGRKRTETAGRCKGGCIYSRSMQQPYPRLCVRCGHPDASAERRSTPRVSPGDAVEFFTTAGCYRPAGEWRDNSWHAFIDDGLNRLDAAEPFPVLALVTTVHPGGFYVNLRVLPESQFVGVEFGVPHDPDGGAFTWRERE